MDVLDLRKIPCPRNTSKALIYLATVDTGNNIQIFLDDGEPILNVPSSLEIEGHQVVSNSQTNEGHWILIVKAA